MSSAYETAFSFAAAQGDVAGAFSIVERVRGRITAETRVQPTHFSPDRTNIALEDIIRNLKIELIKADSTEERNRLIEALFYAEQQRYVEDKPGPVYAAKIEAVPLNRVTAQLDNNEALLEYVLPESGSGYCLLLSRRASTIIRLGSAPAISTLAQKFLDELKNDKPWKQSARALYDAALTPVPDIGRFQHLTIVPDGYLHLVPIDALISPSGILVGEAAITAYAPSAVSGFLLRTRPEAQVSQTFLGVGGAIYDRGETKPFVLAKANTRGGYLGIDPSKLPNLPGSQDEVQSAAKILRASSEGAMLQTGDRATARAFTHAPLAKFQVIHLAIHAVADQDDPSRAALIFPPDPQHQDDGLLEPSEIANLHLQAAVVVLSACNTATGPLQGQVGVANIARAVLQAGADSVVSTLWPINDLQSAYLMKEFYTHLANGKPAADALALAKRDMLRESGADTPPQLWAGSVLLGNGNASLQTSQAAVRQSKRVQ